MRLLAHHIGIEILGREFSPETPMEHVMVFGIGLVFLVLMGYGAYALVRDVRRWRRGDSVSTN